MNKKFVNFFIKYHLIILGGIIFLIYFWNRFLRSRTSKILPLTLSTLKFFLILNVCLVFFFILLSLLRSRKQNVFIEQIINWLFTPIIEFDKYIKHLPFIKPYYERILTYSIFKLDFLIIKTQLFYIIFWIFPRIIMLTALFIDVFIFHQLHYKYIVMPFKLTNVPTLF